jgi:hypothetical protein
LRSDSLRRQDIDALVVAAVTAPAVQQLVGLGSI